MTVLGVFAILLMQWFIGWGVLRLLKSNLPPIQELGISTMLGMGISSTIPLFLEVLSMPIDGLGVLVGHFALVLAFNYSHKFSLDKLRVYLLREIYGIGIAEIFPLIIAAILLIPVYWAAYYLPPVALDFLRGPAILSKFALEEGTLISSVFTREVVYAGTNLYKPPFLLGQEINYQAMGLSFGKLWHVFLHFSFMMVLYNIIRNKAHGIIAGILLVIWIAIPEQYAHLYFILHDLPHALYLSIVFYLLLRYLDEGDSSFFWLSVILSALATLLRAEHLLFIGLGSIVFLIRSIPNFNLKYVLHNGIWIAAPVVVYLLWMEGFVGMLMPQAMDIGGEVQVASFSFGSFLNRFGEIIDRLVLSDYAKNVFLYFWYILPFLVIANLVIRRNTKGWEWLLWILCVYIAYALMLEMIPLVKIDMTVKRGLFKMAPLILLYGAYSNILPFLGEKIKSWESS